MMAGEIKKMYVFMHMLGNQYALCYSFSTQPNSRKRLIGTGSFFQDSFVLQVANRYLLEFRLKSRCCKNALKIDKKKMAKDVAEYWYQNYVRFTDFTALYTFLIMHYVH